MTDDCFVRVANWLDAPPGSLLFCVGQSFFSHWIENLEMPMATYKPRDEVGVPFLPSHVAIKFDDNLVVEAWFDLRRNSAATVGSARNYIPAIIHDWVRLYRPPGTNDQLKAAAIWLVNSLDASPYPWWNLVGFALQRWLHLKNNPIKWGHVCSQSAWFMLEHLAGLIEVESATKLRAVLALGSEGNANPLSLYQAISFVA